MLRGFGLVIVAVGLSTGASASDRDTIIASCEGRLKAPERTCGCMADKAVAEFNSRELLFFEAVMAKGVAGAMMAGPAGLTKEEMNHVAGRVSVLPSECVGG